MPENATAGERRRCRGFAEEETTYVQCSNERADIEGHSGARRAMGRRGQGKGRGHVSDGR